MKLCEIHLFRMMHISNLNHVVANGMHSRKSPLSSSEYVNVGNLDVIARRSDIVVPIHGFGTLGEYVPFYLSGHQPMLYNIITGYGGLRKTPQDDLCIVHVRLDCLIHAGLQFVYTDGNASVKTTRFFSDLESFDKLPWEAIRSSDFRTRIHGPDRIRQKQSELLVRNYVPADLIEHVVLPNERVKDILLATPELKSITDKVYVDVKHRIFFAR